MFRQALKRIVMNRGGVILVAGVMALAFAGSSTISYAIPISAKVTKSQNQGTGDVLALTPLSTTTTDNFSDPYGLSKSQSKVYTFNLKGKWGVKFDVNQPETAPSGFNDIDAGAFYTLTPSLRVGGTLGFGEKSDPLKPEPNNQLQNKKQPRVRLETTFKF